MTIIFAGHTFVFTHREAVCITLLEIDFWIVSAWAFVKHRQHRRARRG